MRSCASRSTSSELTAAQLPRIDVVLISHNHYDHLDVASVQALNAQAGGPPLFIAPLGTKKWLAGVGITNAIDLDWWDAHTVKTAQGGVEFVLTPAQHWSARTPFDRSDALWGGFAAFASDFHFFYSGDTGYSQDFKAIQQRFASRQSAGGFDIALLPVGCYEPRWFMATQHANPEDATQIHLDLKSKRSVGVHWGTFHGLCDEPLDQAPKDLAAARAKQGLSEEQFFVMKLGETRVLPRRQ
jgi:N-acyl-phosphatidylethanolamine-hydrolysing phospholipase D